MIKYKVLNFKEQTTKTKVHLYHIIYFPFFSHKKFLSKKKNIIITLSRIVIE